MEQEELVELICFLAIGVAAGWIAGLIMKGRGFGLVGNMVVGVVGAFLGGHLLGLLGIEGLLGIAGSGLIESLLVAVVGAVVLLAIVGALKRA